MEVELRQAVPDGLTVFETMRQEADGTVPLWPLHLARLRRGCRAVGFPMDDDAAIRPLSAALAPSDGVMRLRLSINARGRAEVTRQPLPPNPPHWRVILSDVRLDSADPWLCIKTSNRPAYDLARAGLPDGVDEAILLNERGEVCEGTITSLFLRRGRVLLTPPLSSGVLPGVLRQSLLQSGAAREAVLHPADLAHAELFMGNALRGVIPTVLC